MYTVVRLLIIVLFKLLLEYLVSLSSYLVSSSSFYYTRYGTRYLYFGTLITMMRERVVVVVSRRILLNETYYTFHKVLRSLHVVYNCFHNCFCNCFWDERFIFLI